MKTDKNTHNLGSEWCPGSQNWFYLIIEESGKWRVVMEKDYDIPDRERYLTPLEPKDFSKYKVYEIPLAEAVAKKLSELGLNPNSTPS
jgi:hypothetical protein